MTIVEEKLAECGAAYALLEQEISKKTPIEETTEQKLGELEEKVDEERCENKIIGKLENLEVKFDNLTTRFENMEKKFDDRDNEKTKQIKEIQKMLKKIMEMMSSKDFPSD